MKCLFVLRGGNRGGTRHDCCCERLFRPYARLARSQFSDSPISYSSLHIFGRSSFRRFVIFAWLLEKALLPLPPLTRTD
jgi:hypothetical protein